MRNFLPKINVPYQYKFIGMIAVVIAISLILVAVSMEMYNSSGAAQVDLSRPGYDSVRKQAGDEAESTEETFSATGEIDSETLKKFKETYDKHAKRSLSAGNFGSGALSDDSLQIFVEGVEESHSAEGLDAQ